MTRMLRPAERAQLNEALIQLHDLLQSAGVVSLVMNRAGVSYDAPGPVDAHALAAFVQVVDQLWSMLELERRRGAV